MRRVKLFKVHDAYNDYYDDWQPVLAAGVVDWIEVDEEEFQKINEMARYANGLSKNNEARWLVIEQCSNEETSDLFRDAKEFLKAFEERQRKQEERKVKEAEKKKAAALARKKKQLEKLKAELEDNE